MIFLTDTFVYSDYCTYTGSTKGGGGSGGGTGGPPGSRNLQAPATTTETFYFHIYIYSNSGSLVGSTTTSFLSFSSSTQTYISCDFEDSTSSLLVLFKSYFLFVGV